MSALLIFDCDGVLVDSELLEHAVDAELLGPLGCSASADQLLQRFVGIARRDMYEVVFGELKRAMPEGLLEERERRVWSRCASDLRRVPGVELALAAWHRGGSGGWHESDWFHRRHPRQRDARPRASGCWRLVGDLPYAGSAAGRLVFL